MWRDLCEDWTSPAGRIVQVGDSVHSFLPSSGNGASQAMEDAITLATCLQLGGRNNVSIATKVYNKLQSVQPPSLIYYDMIPSQPSTSPSGQGDQRAS